MLVTFLTTYFLGEVACSRFPVCLSSMLFSGHRAICFRSSYSSHVGCMSPSTVSQTDYHGWKGRCC